MRPEARKDPAWLGVSFPPLHSPPVISGGVWGEDQGQLPGRGGSEGNGVVPRSSFMVLPLPPLPCVWALRRGSAPGSPSPRPGIQGSCLVIWE